MGNPVGEPLEDKRGRLVEDWRVERADSAIVLLVWGARLVLPGATYRPGIGRATRDFPGGRIVPPHTAWDVAWQALQRELAIIAAAALQHLVPPTPRPIPRQFVFQ